MAACVSWRDFELYVITAANHHRGRSLAEVMEQTLIGGAGMLQLRNKTGSRKEVLEEAKVLRQLTRRYDVPFIVNDYPDIALEVDADGVHLGQEDLSIEEAREMMGEGKIIGISTHNIAQALAAEEAGADYIGVGPVYPTDTKPGRSAVTTSFVEEAARRIRIPFVAIGGITLSNVDQVLAAGARRICAVSAIVASEDPAGTCRSFLAAIRKSGYSSGNVDPFGIGDARATAGPSITIWVNGQERQTTADDLDSLIDELGQSGKRIVAELNGIIVHRTKWRAAKLVSDAKVELIQFVGGG
ncbi:thiamine phosphate synthase [Paenibacillus sp. GCM10027627]|uniref:thiamine phosphate synthase n=1 Tax=unclassified Paenibacillus TaxID=185978 RepID=UPI0036294E8B